MKEQYQREHEMYIKHMKQVEVGLNRDCEEMEKEFHDNLANYSELMKEEEEEGFIYKNKMMEQLDRELTNARHHG